MKDDGVRAHDRTFHTDHDNGHDRGGRYSCIVRGGGDAGTGRVASLTLLQASFRPVKSRWPKLGKELAGRKIGRANYPIRALATQLTNSLTVPPHLKDCFECSE